MNHKVLQMNIKTLAFALAAIPATAVSAVAAPFCTGAAGVNLSFGFMIGSQYTEEDRTDLAQIELRRRGVDATRVEFWNGCLRAYVRRPGSGEVMEFYDPDTYEQVF